MKTVKEFKARWPEMFDKKDNGNFYCPAGWTDMVWSLCGDIEQALEGDFDGFQVDQVKEKFGGLRFYISVTGESSDAKDEVRALVSAAELASLKICVSCGGSDNVALGTTGARRGWISTECAGCRDTSHKVEK